MCEFSQLRGSMRTKRTRYWQKFSSARCKRLQTSDGSVNFARAMPPKHEDAPDGTLKFNIHRSSRFVH